jgi:hypothetical protein
MAFLMTVLVGAKRFAHAGLLRGDQALHALLGMKRFPTDDTICNLFRKFGMGEIQRLWWLHGPHHDGAGPTVKRTHPWNTDHRLGPNDDRILKQNERF